MRNRNDARAKVVCLPCHALLVRGETPKRATIGALSLEENFGVLDTQWAPGRAASPEERLMESILEHARYDLRLYRNKTGARERRLYEEARDWFLDTDDSWLYAFESICLVLGLNAHRVRRALGLLSTTQPAVEAAERRGAPEATP